MQQLHGPETAGRLALRSFPTASPADFAATVRDRLTRGSHEITDLVLVTDSAGHYQGVVELRQILQAREDQPVAALMRTDWPTVSPETDQEHAVEAANRSRRRSASGRHTRWQTLGGSFAAGAHAGARP